MSAMSAICGRQALAPRASRPPYKQGFSQLRIAGRWPSARNFCRFTRGREELSGGRPTEGPR